MDIKIWGTAEDGTYKRKRRSVNDFAQLMEQGKTIIRSYIFMRNITKQFNHRKFYSFHFVNTT